MTDKKYHYSAGIMEMKNKNNPKNNANPIINISDILVPLKWYYSEYLYLSLNMLPIPH